MFLIQVLLPLYDNEGKPFANEVIGRIKSELTNQFGGLTAYTRAPAEGFWTEDAATQRKDDIVVLEVMTEALDTAWWRQFRHALEDQLRQQSIIIRSQEMQLL